MTRLVTRKIRVLRSVTALYGYCPAAGGHTRATEIRHACMTINLNQKPFSFSPFFVFKQWYRGILYGIIFIIFNITYALVYIPIIRFDGFSPGPLTRRRFTVFAVVAARGHVDDLTCTRAQVQLTSQYRYIGLWVSVGCTTTALSVYYFISNVHNIIIIRRPGVW